MSGRCLIVMIVYPGELQTNCFRIGTIGLISVEDVQALVAAVGTVLQEMGMKIRD